MIKYNNTSKKTSIYYSINNHYITSTKFMIKNIIPSNISTPKKGKTAIELILKKVDEKQHKNMTISSLIDEINKQTEDKQLHIFLDHFEHLTRRELTYYRQLSENKNITIIANITEDQDLIDEEFLQKFIIVDDKFYTNRSLSINIQFSLLLVFTILVFLLFLKIQLSIVGIIVSTLWFTFLMYRSFYYMIRR